MESKEIWTTHKDIPTNIREMLESDNPKLYSLMENEPVDNIFYLLRNSIYYNDTNKFIKIFANFYQLIIGYTRELNDLFKFATNKHTFDIAIYLLDNSIDATIDDNFAIRNIAGLKEDASDFIQKLINYGANPTANDCEPLRTATNHGHINNVQALLNNGGYIKSNNLDKCLVKTLMSKNNLEKTKLLFEHGINFNTRAEWMEDMTSHAVEKGRTDMVKYLINIGVDLNDKRNFLESAVIYQDAGFDMIKLLLENGANVNSLDADNLVDVIMSGDTTVVELLVQYGADFTKVNNYKNRRKNHNNHIKVITNLGVDPIKLAEILAIKAIPLKAKKKLK